MPGAEHAEEIVAKGGGEDFVDFVHDEGDAGCGCGEDVEFEEAGADFGEGAESVNVGVEGVGEFEIVGDGKAEGGVEELGMLEGFVVEELEIDGDDFAALFAAGFFEAGEEGGFAHLA